MNQMRTRIAPDRRRLGAALSIAAFMTVAAAATPASAETTITVTHPATPAPTFIDNGTPGESAGDVRIFHFDGTADDGGTVRTDWIMTTTGIGTLEENVDSRVTLGVFSFDDGPEDQLLLQGVAFYPKQGATLKASSSTIRTIVGGTGAFAGASGWVDSNHLEDGTWRHVFHIE